jgi:hypothetical protein
MSHYRIASQQYDFERRRRLAIIRVDQLGVETVAKPLVFEPLDERELIEATIDRSGEAEQFLQACLDHAWDLGMPPAGFLDTTRETAALKEHLHDMRALVFKGDVKARR